MTTPLLLAERVTALEYAVFGEFPATMAAMSHGATHLYAETVANGEAIAGLRFDMAAFRKSVHRDVSGLRADMDQRFEAVDQRFDAVDQRFDAVDERFEAVDRRFDAVDQRFDAVDARFEGLDTQLRDLRVGMDAKLDTILSELRKPAD
jgi:hypothetical protein